jgi:hypothetical protein
MQTACPFFKSSSSDARREESNASKHYSFEGISRHFLDRRPAWMVEIVIPSSSPFNILRASEIAVKRVLRYGHYILVGTTQR